MALFNLKTGKPLDGPEATMVSDLDAMVAQPVAFRLHGKVHQIRAISVREFYAFTNAMLGIQTLEKAEHVTPAQVIDVYEKLIRAVCDTVTRADVEQMTQAQCGALLNLIVECVTGKAYAEVAGEKKTPEIPAPTLKDLNFPQPSRWQKVAAYLTGPLRRR